MKSSKPHLKLKFIFTLLIAIFSVTTLITPAIAGDKEDLDAVQRKLAEIRKEQQDLNNRIKNEKNLGSQYNAEIYKLNNEISQLQLNVEEKNLVIEQYELNISLLNEQIEDTEKKVAEKEEEIRKLEEETDERLAGMYLDIKSFDNSVNMIFATEGEGDFIKDGLYREAIQEDTNDKLARLATEKENLEKDKEKLNADRIQVETDKSLLEEERKALESDQTVLSQKRNKYEALKRQSDNVVASNQLELKGLNSQAAQLYAEQELLMQRIFNEVGSIPSGQYVLAGTIIGREGCTGLCTGEHLHYGMQLNGSYVDPCAHTKSIPAVNGSCGGNKPQFKNAPMTGTNYITSRYGWRDLGGYSKFHYAVDISNTANGAAVYATHNGYLYRGFEPCNPSYWLCKGGGANWAIVCEKQDCKTGYKTMYYHLRK